MTFQVIALIKLQISHVAPVEPLQELQEIQTNTGVKLHAAAVVTVWTDTNSFK